MIEYRPFVAPISWGLDVSPRDDADDIGHPAGEPATSFGNSSENLRKVNPSILGVSGAIVALGETSRAT